MNYEKLYSLMAEQDLDAILLCNRENPISGINVTYTSGFKGSFGFVLISKKLKLFFTDFRYSLIAKEQVKEEFEIIEMNASNKGIMNDICNEHKFKKVGFDKSISYGEYELLADQFDAELVPMKNIIQKLRMVKTEDELVIMRKAAEIADKAFEHILTFIKPGLAEIEIADELERKMKELGAVGHSFDPIVASGPRGCLPHGRASEKKVQTGELITMDFGAYYNGYASDITRTVALGEIDPKLEEIYNIVLESQIAGVNAVKAGILGSDVDKVCRDIIDSKGYKKEFGHGTGHGLGMEVHEAPSCGSKSTDVLEHGNVVTVEPGIYIPDFGGVRIEDDVVVKDGGFEVLTKSPKQLIKL